MAQNHGVSNIIIIIKALQPWVGLGLVKQISPSEAVRSFFPSPNSQNPHIPLNSITPSTPSYAPPKCPSSISFGLSNLPCVAHALPIAFLTV
ncbi:jg430 [Pararge aegeria aegeria]|uniref:Jg430 protein n=1 Tax=Pararge aegeria aegeria TaxID=348720 RepID=A0A8S4QVE8_9NEOP|nr:jg430 [Pararge aegeria aegeria]